MGCPDCNQNTPLVFNVQSFIDATCGDCGDTQCLSSKYVCYQGSALPCSGIATGDDLETVLTKIDEQICSISGDYSTYQFNCLPAYFGQAITTEAEFVDAITSYACAIATNLQTFTGVTFPQYQSEVTAQISTIDGPSLTCTSAGVNSNDNLSTILTKYCAKFSSIDDAIDLTDIDFGDCFSVVTQPQTIHQGFVEVLSQICQVKTIAEGASGVLPTFNNIGSCLAAPLTSTDSLEDTVIKLRTKVCSIDSSFDGTTITWGCGAPDGDTLQEAVQALANASSTNTLNSITEVSSDFILELVDKDIPCAGKKLSLATPLNQDRFVASNSADTTPGTLVDKLTGNGIDVDDTTTPGQIILTPDHKVLADATDTVPNYLVDKLEGSTVNGITITPVYNALTGKVTLQLTVDDSLFCAAVSTCVPVTCNQYLVTNPDAFSRPITWMQCDGSTVEMSIEASSAMSICARLGSVVSAGCTIVATGECTTTTTIAP